MAETTRSDIEKAMRAIYRAECEAGEAAFADDWSAVEFEARNAPPGARGFDFRCDEIKRKISVYLDEATLAARLTSVAKAAIKEDRERRH